jgi:predicted nucleic acid-binding protein
MKFFLILSFLHALAFSMPLARLRLFRPRIADAFRPENVQNLARERAIQLNRARQELARARRQAQPRNLQDDFDAVAAEQHRAPIVTPDGRVNRRVGHGNLITPETPAGGSVPNLEADSVARRLDFE